ncbi:MAG: guanylate kinase, partial [Candidatus Latescibacteria bacterium]|nr:guanylate kinase [Candidatus Latescibacterota bacterium]
MAGERMMSMGKGLIMVVSAPSGAGKSSVLAGMLENNPGLMFSVSVTTRSPRIGERSGVHYTFVSESEFGRMIENGEFAEWAEVHGHRYGTLKKTLDDALAHGASIVLDTDTVGALNIRRLYSEAVLV